ncbi:MAG: peroxiredoxin family protein [Phycisphaerae bacterium]|nr:hypothetical protein [Phycisphaerae bacterium]MCZ2399256.1 peroxiredoxin family protein [Phycisphaerae bacterium]
MRALFLASLAVMFLAGCASQPPARGWSPRVDSPETGVRVGDRYVDFAFQDQSGKERSLRRDLGDYTVVLFTECESDTHQPAGDLLDAILSAGQYGNSNVKLVGVNVHWCKTGCKDGQHCHLVDAKPNLGSICDGAGAVRRAYGAGTEDWLFVIGPEKTIELSAPALQGAGLSKQLKHRADQLSEERVRASFRYSDAPW